MGGMMALGKNVVLWVLLALGSSWTTPSLANMTCVQQELTDLGFDPGPVDGSIGNMTVSAATLFATNAGLTLEPLDEGNAKLWCGEIQKFASSPDAKTISRLDLVSEPEGVLSEKDQQRLWKAYTTAKVCLEHPAWGEQKPVAVRMYTAERFAATPWVSPFTRTAGSPLCKLEPGRLNPPPVISNIKLNEAYGERLFDVDTAAKWFRRLTTYERYSSDPVAHQLLKQALVDWAKGDALGSGIRVSYGKKPIDYQMLVTIASILTATGEIAGDFTAEERAIVGPWMNGLVDVAAGSVWQFRYDNKFYMARYVALLWALMVGDEATVQDVIFAYKLAIHDMRPDGSFPVDSQRGGMGLVYNAGSAGHLVNIAAALRTARGINLFDYAVDGRSVHTAVGYVVGAMQDPGTANARYAISCPDAGDRWGSIDEPSTFFLEESDSYLRNYATQFPERESSKAILAHLGPGRAIDSERAGLSACLYASVGGDVTLPPLELPKPADDLTPVDFVVASVIDGEEQNPVGGGASSFYLNLRSGIVENRTEKALADNELNYTLKGVVEATGALRQLSIIINSPLGKDKPAALRDCGAKTETDDLGNQRVVLRFTIEGKTLKADDIGCILKALPKSAAFQAGFVVDSMQDIAAGLVAAGDVEGIANPQLRDLFGQLARSEIVLARGDAGADTPEVRDPTALPKPALTVTTAEKFVKNPGKATEIISLLESRIKGAKKGQNSVEFTVLGHYSYPTDSFLDLSLIIQEGLGKDRPDVLNACPGTRTEFYDDEHHVVIRLVSKDGGWVLDKIDCLIANLPKKQAFVAQFLATSFQDIAIGLVKSGDVKVLENDGLRSFMTKVAFGELKVAASSP